MTDYSRSGNIYSPITTTDIIGTLPPATFMVAFNPMAGFYLEKVDDMTSPPELYGDIPQKAVRVIKTYLDRPFGTGVLLTGAKGSGKTMFAKVMSSMMREMGHPTILVNQPWVGDQFNALLKSIEQPYMLFLDEFEKVYADPSHQSAMLTVLDGSVEARSLNVVTTNDEWKLHDAMRNRPGRFFYRFSYKGLSDEMVRDYCERKLNDKTKIDEVIRFASLFAEFNFDLMKAIVEEMNRYEEGVVSASKYLNAVPTEGQVNYKVTVLEILDPDKIEEIKEHGKTLYTKNVSTTPAVTNVDIIFYDKNYDHDTTFHLEPKDIKSMTTGSFIYKTDEIAISLERIVRQEFDVMSRFDMLL